MKPSVSRGGTARRSSHANGWLDRVGRWFGWGGARAELPPVRAKAPQAGAAPIPDASGSRRSANAPAVLDASDGFAPYAAVLALAERPPRDDSGIDPARLDAVADQLLAHFYAHRPEPHSAPKLSLRILNRIADPQVELKELSHLIAQDAAVATSVLRVANSAAVRGEQEIDTLHDAVARLGLRDVASIAGAVAARTLFNPETKAEIAIFRGRWRELFLDAAVVGMGASWISLDRDIGRPDHAFLGGMLHDVGKPVALRSLAALLTSGSAEGALTDPFIDRLLERVHVEIGTEVHRAWNLPAFLAPVFSAHHDVHVPMDGDHAEVHAVRVASGLRALRSSREPRESGLGELHQSLVQLRITPLALRAADTRLMEYDQTVATAVGG